MFLEFVFGVSRCVLCKIQPVDLSFWLGRRCRKIPMGRHEVLKKPNRRNQIQQYWPLKLPLYRSNWLGPRAHGIQSTSIHKTSVWETKTSTPSPNQAFVPHPYFVFVINYTIQPHIISIISYHHHINLNHQHHHIFIRKQNKTYTSS